MKSRRIHAEHLLGRIVHDADGRRVGRIEEIEAEQTRNGCYISSFILGEHGLLKRLAIRGIEALLFRSITEKGVQRTRGVPWDKLDISNPKRPRLRWRRDELLGKHGRT